MRALLLISFLLVLSHVGYAQKTITINGYAPKYIGLPVQLNVVSDYLTQKESTIATAEVGEDSTFTLITYLEEAQKLVLYVGKNSSFMYAQPGGDYTIYFPDRDRREPARPMGNKVEISFLDLDSNDINDRIMIFNNSLDNFLLKNYKKSRTEPAVYNKNFDLFKENISTYFKQDTGTYVYDYIRYSLASIDNLPQSGNRNKYEKFDFYLKFSPVRYNNDAYMDYFKTYYAGMINSLPMERNNEVYMSVVKASPTLMMRALGKEITLANVRMRELVMIQALGEMYYRKDYPQTNVLAILDSLETHALFQAHRPIAANMKSRLKEIASGSKAPEFILTKTDETKKSLNDFKGKYVYMHFFDPLVENASIELDLLLSLHKKYGQQIEFITIVPTTGYKQTSSQELLKKVKWDVFLADDYSSSIWKNYQIKSFPYYVLLDAQGYVVQAPALTPKANALYETIDHTFFEIKKVLDRQNGERGR